MPAIRKVMAKELKRGSVTTQQDVPALSLRAKTTSSDGDSDMESLQSSPTQVDELRGTALPLREEGPFSDHSSDMELLQSPPTHVDQPKGTPALPLREEIPPVHDNMNGWESLQESPTQFNQLEGTHSLLDTSGTSRTVPNTDPTPKPSVTPQKWENLHPSLQTVLPPDEEYTYVIEAYQPKQLEAFPGAPEYAFECQVRINLRNEEEAMQWLQKMQEHGHCTYRVTRTSKPGLRRVLFKTERHCHHFRKKLTAKQTSKAAAAKSRKEMRPLTGMLRDKKTQCPSQLTIQIPTKKPRRLAEKNATLITHSGVLKLSYLHNHPIMSAHALSF